VSSDPRAIDSPLIVPLCDPAVLNAGGKAKGLHLLLRAGARVPDGFVIPDADAPRLEEALRAHLGGFGLPHQAYAIRSSGLEEDGTQASFAGQYETILNVRGFDAVMEAVRACRDSASSRRVREYAARRAQGARPRIPVIVQRMVDARRAGVLFTADPVSNRRDRLVINAVAGLGESLVGGRSAGEQYTFSRGGRELAYSGSSPTRLLSRGMLDALRSESLRIQGIHGSPVDLEWAIDGDGTLYWLQLRPITTLAPVHVNELDCAPAHPERHLLTRCNVGEMMPGPVTPLTWSVFARGIDAGMQDFLVRLHVLDRIHEENRFIFMFYGHLFIDMTPLYGICQKVAFTTKKDVDHNISGRDVDGAEPPRTRPALVRFRNFLAYIYYFLDADRRLGALRRLAGSLAIPLGTDARGTYRAIDARLPCVFTAWSHHYATSGKSGSLNSALLRILESDGAGTMQDHLGTLAGLLTRLGGIDGALALEELEGIRGAILSDARVRDAFLHEPYQRCLSLLRTSESGDAGLRFRRFLRNHGHRCVREAELRESSWESDPGALIRMLQRDVARRGSAGGDAPPCGPADGVEGLLSRYSRRTRSIARSVLPLVRRGVIARENSKSLCIRIQFRFRKAYLHLGGLLAASGLLDDPDQVFFLTHQELGGLLEKPGPWGRETARARRELYPSLFDFQFDDFTRGVPEPSEGSSPQEERDGVLQGIPVSAGVVTGRARVVDTLADAEELAPGEIMIASYTDIGWTPYFGSISGLVTEIGSTLSHGAVVAREYGIPAIVSVRGAKNRIRTGDTLTIDGRRGIIEVHQEA
jgi:rifampicin phosphotransferase